VTKAPIRDGHRTAENHQFKSKGPGANRSQNNPGRTSQTTSGTPLQALRVGKEIPIGKSRP
jgi:hypothetical protein